MNPHFLSPLGNVGEGRFVAEEFLERGVIAKSFGQGSVFKPNCMENSFTPEIFREIGRMKHGTNTLKKAVVESFRNAIVFWHVMSGKTPFCTFLFKILSEFIASELLSMVRVKAFDGSAVLSFCPSHK